MQVYTVESQLRNGSPHLLTELSEWISVKRVLDGVWIDGSELYFPMNITLRSASAPLAESTYGG